MNRIWAWLHARNWRTWVGHGLQAFIIMAIGTAGWGIGAGLFANAVHWPLREGPGIVKAVRGGDTAKLVDGLGDLAGPMVGIALYALLLA